MASDVKIGPLVREIKADMAYAFQAQDVDAIKACDVKYHALKALVSEYRGMRDGFFDSAHAGFSETEWLEGVERLVKINPDKPRGRPAAVKVDPADLV